MNNTSQSKTVTTAFNIRLATANEKRLVRDSSFGIATRGKYFKSGTLTVGPQGDFVAHIKSYIALESDVPVVVTAYYADKTVEFDSDMLFVLHGDIGKVWVRPKDSDSKAWARINYHISTDDGEPDGYVRACVTNGDIQKLKLRMLPRITTDVCNALPTKHDLLTQGIPEEVAAAGNTSSIAARTYSGYLRKLHVVRDKNTA
jgi:hypothetical protein